MIKTTRTSRISFRPPLMREPVFGRTNNLNRPQEDAGLATATIAGTNISRGILEPVPVRRNIRLPKESIIKLEAGLYSNLGGLAANNPLHQTKLSNDISLFPLTAGFLREQFIGRYDPVQGKKIEERQDLSRPQREFLNSIFSDKFNLRRKGEQILRYINLLAAFEIMEILNARLTGGLRLRLPSEAVVEVLVTSGKLPKGIALILTSSLYDPLGVRNDESVVDLKKEQIDMADLYAYGYDRGDPSYPSRSAKKYGRFMVSPNSEKFNTNVIFEVIPAYS